MYFSVHTVAQAKLYMQSSVLVIHLCSRFLVFDGLFQKCGQFCIKNQHYNCDYSVCLSYEM